MVNMYTKHEVSMFTHYEDMKGDEKYNNWGGLGGDPMSSVTLPFDRAHMTSYSTLIENMHLSCTVFVTERFLSKVANFNPPHLHLSSL